MSKKANLRERILNVFSPELAQKAYNARQMAERDFRMDNGFGNHGASTTRNYALGWITGQGSAEQDIDLHGAILRERARDLDTGGGIARGAVRRLQTTVVGAGLVPKPRINAEVLGMTPEAAVEWERRTKAEFMAWAESKCCDAAGERNFFQLQGLIILSMLISGDVFVMLPEIEEKNTPYKIHIRVLEADRVATPDSGGDTTAATAENGNRIIDGVEVDENGRVVAYYVTNRHPLNSNDDTEVEYNRIEATGGETGMPNILHPFEADRPEQRRGAPFIAPVIEQVKQLDRYMNSELMANIISSMLTVFFTSDNDTVGLGMEEMVGEGDRVTDEEEKIELTSGGIVQLKPGVHPETVNPMRNNVTFASYVDAMVTYIGSALSIPYEVLNEKFTASYSASRAAILEFWRGVKMRRQWFQYDVCQPIYEAWLTEAVALGRIECAGFFDDPLTRAAWCGVEWVGSSMGQLDPKSEVAAAMLRIQTGLSTREREATELNGSDWTENAQQLIRESAEMREINAALMPEQLVPEPEQEPGPDEETEGQGDENEV